MKKLIVAILIASSAFATVNVNACKGCHGLNFEKHALGKSKIVKNMTHDEIVTALKGYKNGTYGASMKGIMKSQVSKYSDTQIEELATLIKPAKVSETTVTTETTKVSKDVKGTIVNLDKGNSSKGLKIYRKKLLKKCGFNGGVMAKKHTQEEWQNIGKSGQFLNEIKKQCPEVKSIKERYLPNLLNFLYDYASDSGNVPSC